MLELTDCICVNVDHIKWIVVYQNNSKWHVRIECSEDDYHTFDFATKEEALHKKEIILADIEYEISSRK